MEAPDRPRNRRLIRLPLLVALHASAASAGVTFEPSVAVGVLYTDNLFLEADDPDAERIYQLRPGLSLQQESRRFTTDVDFGVEAYRYDDLGESDVYQNGSGRFVAALDPDNFFFEIGALRGQTVRQPDMSVPWSNVPISTNRIDRDSYYAGPNFDYPFGTNLSAGGSFRRERVHYDQPATATIVQELTTDSTSFSLDNHRKEQGFSWAVLYESESTDFGISEPWQYRQAGIELGVWMSSQVRLFAAGGRESAWDDPFDASFEDSYWEAGFAATGETLVAELAFGERTFGSSKRVSLEAVQERWRTGLSYSESPTSVSRDLYDSGFVIGVEPDSLIDLLTRPGTPEQYISKLARWSFAVELSRTVVSGSLYDELREQRRQLGGVLLEDERQSGAELSARWSAGPHTELFIDVHRQDVDLVSGKHQLSGWSVGADRRLGRRTSLSLSYGHHEDTPDFPAAGGYRSNIVELLLTRNAFDE
jgi:uncharacterized protein (PEP-CTERM system associated)